MEGYEDDISLSPASPKQDPEDTQRDVKFNPDEDVYEDAFDLDISQQNQRVMLVRLPEYLMSKLQQNEQELSGADLGKVYIPQGPNANFNKMRLHLNPQISVLRQLPHKYDMNVLKKNVDNTFIIKEKDSRVRKSEVEGEGFKRIKRTAMAGHAMNECTLTADMNDPNYRYVLMQRKSMEVPDQERQTTMLDSLAGVGGAKYGATLRQQKDAWRKQVQKKQLAKHNSEGKAIRIPRNELLDMLFRAFEEEPYWTTKELKERTKQPEVYLKSVLESIAVLNKRGPQAMKYELKEEYKVLQNSGASVESMVQQIPNVPDSPIEGLDDGDSDDMEMENVEIA